MEEINAPGRMACAGWAWFALPGLGRFNLHCSIAHQCHSLATARSRSGSGQRLREMARLSGPLVLFRSLQIVELERKFGDWVS